MEETNPPKKNNLRWWILLTVIVGTFLGRLDQTIVNLALPKIIDDFGITVSAAGWIATAYIIANAIFVPIWGKLGDTLGRKKVYILGFSIFIVGSVLAGLAWNLSSMIVFRVIQAIAGSADYPTAMAILAITFREPKERAQALGIWSSSFAAATVFGPLLGGPLIDHLGWRSVFLINLPIGIIGIWMALKYINESKSEVKVKFFDWWGASALGGMLSAMVLVLDQGTEWGWLSVSSIICYVVFIRKCAREQLRSVHGNDGRNFFDPSICSDILGIQRNTIWISFYADGRSAYAWSSDRRNAHRPHTVALRNLCQYSRRSFWNLFVYRT